MEQFVRSKGAERYRRLLENVHEDGSVPKNTWQLTIYCLLAEVRRKQKDRTITFIEFLGKLIRPPPF